MCGMMKQRVSLQLQTICRGCARELTQQQLPPPSSKSSFNRSMQPTPPPTCFCRSRGAKPKPTQRNPRLRMLQKSAGKKGHKRRASTALRRPTMRTMNCNCCNSAYDLPLLQFSLLMTQAGAVDPSVAQRAGANSLRHFLLHFHGRLARFFAAFLRVAALDQCRCRRLL